MVCLLTLYMFCDIVLSQSMLFVSFGVLAILIICCVLKNVTRIMRFVCFRFEFDAWSFLLVGQRLYLFCRDSS